jgi:hypothetical protein
LAELKQMGYAKAAIIGLVLEQSEDLTPITLVSAYGDS